MLTFLGKTDN